MKYRALLIVSALALPALVPVSEAAAAATVNYQGRLYLGASGPIGSGPVSSGFVVAGTFAPGFVPADYFYVYGDDVGNAIPGFYSDSVADGGFRPIGSGVLTDANGFFSGTGTTNEPAGTPIYLFGFGVPDPDFAIAGVLATSSLSSFLVPADMSSTSIDASQAKMTFFGQAVIDGLAISLLPIPEPASCSLLLMGLMLFPRTRRL